MTRGPRFAAALAGVVAVGCGGQVAHETDAGADAVVVDTGSVDTGSVDTGSDVPPKSPGTCTGGGVAVTCAPGLTCALSGASVGCSDGTGRPPGRHCGVILCDIACSCDTPLDSACSCPVAVPGPLPPPELSGADQTVRRPAIARPSVT